MPSASRRVRLAAAGAVPNRMVLPADPHNPPYPDEEEAPASDSADRRQRGHARFLELAQGRMVVALQALDYIGSLSVRARYHYTDAEVEELTDALFNKIAEIGDAFRAGQGLKPSFTFKTTATRVGKSMVAAGAAGVAMWGLLN